VRLRLLLGLRLLLVLLGLGLLLVLLGLGLRLILLSLGLLLVLLGLSLLLVLLRVGLLLVVSLCSASGTLGGGVNRSDPLLALLLVLGGHDALGLGDLNEEELLSQKLKC